MGDSTGQIDRSFQLAVLSPAGRGAIATIRVSGPGSRVAVEALFQPIRKRRWNKQTIDDIVFGLWGKAEGPTEELVVCQRGEETFEVHCHGGSSAVSAIVASLTAVGGSQVTWSELVADSPLRRDLLTALANATTDFGASVLLSQLNGTLASSIETCIREIEAGQVDAARSRLNRLADTYAYGKHLVDPWKVVLAGPPNVGKSSLINAMVGFERAIVFDLPGTTRDVISVVTAIRGWPVELSDTAGLRNSNDEIERAGIAIARKKIESADLCLLVFDIREPNPPEYQGLISEFPEAILVHNKADLVEETMATRPTRQGSAIRTSATTCDGLDELMVQIVNQLAPNPPQSDDAVLSTQWQYDHIYAASAACESSNNDTSMPASLSILQKLLD